MKIDKLLEDILKDKMELRKNHVYDVGLILPKRNYDLIKKHYEKIMNIPVTSIIVDKIEFPMNTLFGMKIMIQEMEEDYKLVRDL